MQSKLFRKDINGLRAVAVLSVVMFHFNKNYLPGGFAGVDVFFVISGYLMTSIIFRGLENNNFSYLKFLHSRSKRIIPALMSVITVLLIFGFLFLEPMSYSLLGKHSFSSLLFLSNINYWLESGYFDINSSKKFLLHTWSLSVEWQFYMIYPFVLLFLKKIFNICTIKKICLVSFVFLFIASLYLSLNKPVFSYFMLPSRTWELLLGGLAFIYPININERKKISLTIIGLFLIIVSFFIVNDHTPWPGYMALFPVVGTYLCIVSGKEFILSLSPLQTIGKYSYSIYLVHWPLLVVMNVFSMEIGLLVFLSITMVISFLLFNIVESKRAFGYKSTLFLFLLIITSYFISINGAKFRVSEQFSYNATDYHEKFYGGTGYISDGNAHRYEKKSSNVLIISGDSFARQYSNYLSKKDATLVTIYSDGCFSSSDYLSTHGDDLHRRVCDERNLNFIDEMKSSPSADVIYAQNWDSYTLKNKNNTLEINISTPSFTSILSDDIISRLITQGGSDRKYYIIGLPPRNDRYSYYECMSRSSLPINKILNKNSCPSTIKYEKNILNEDLKNNLKKYKNVVFIDPYDALCENETCRLVDEKGNPIYSDSVHLSIYGAEFVGKKLLDEYIK